MIHMGERFLPMDMRASDSEVIENATFILNFDGLLGSAIRLSSLVGKSREPIMRTESRRKINLYCLPCCLRGF